MKKTEYSVADQLRLSHGFEGRWLIVSPIYWQATHHDVVLMACGDELNCSDAQARELFAMFATFVEAEGMQAHYHDQYTWLLRCDHKPLITASSPYALLHQSMSSHIQRLDSTLYWQRFITEVQMLFAQRMNHSSKVNGIWIWGGEPEKARLNRTIWIKLVSQIKKLFLFTKSPYFK